MKRVLANGTYNPQDVRAMFKNFSPTTVLSYVQLFAVAAILAKPIYDYWTIENYNAVAGLAGANAIAIAVFTALATIKGHFTADSNATPPDTKTNDTPQTP